MTQDIGAIEKVVQGAGLFLRREFAREDGVVSRQAGQPPINEPFIDTKDTKNSQVYRHIVSDNTSYGTVNHEGKIELRVGYGPVSTEDPRIAVLTVLVKYTRLITSLRENKISYSPDSKLERSIEDAVRQIPLRRSC